MRQKLLLLAGVMLIFTACNHAHTHNDSSQVDGHKEHAHQHDEAMKAPDVVKASALSLNNGEKWKADESTNKHASAINAMADEFERNSDQSLAASQAFANDIQKGLQQLINDCTMKGPDHDALHLWLEPLLIDVKNLKNCDDENEAKIAADVLINDARKFHQFFN